MPSVTNPGLMVRGSLVVFVQQEPKYYSCLGQEDVSKIGFWSRVRRESWRISRAFWGDLLLDEPSTVGRITETRGKKTSMPSMLQGPGSLFHCWFVYLTYRRSSFPSGSYHTCQPTVVRQTWLLGAFFFPSSTCRTLETRDTRDGSYG